MKKKITFILLALLATVGCFATDENAILSKIALNGQQTTSIQCSFTECKHVSVLKNDVFKEGHFYYQSPDKVCMEYTTPKGDILLLNGDKFIMVNGGKRSEMNAQSNPMLKQMRMMLIACMSGNISRIKMGKNSTITIEDDGNQYVVKATIKGGAKSYYSDIVLSYSKSDLSLNKLRMCEANGNYTEYQFHSKQFNKPISSNTFDK